jgi:cbb3-type cytochrome oxidase subunit 3
MMMSLYTRECNAELDLISCDSKEPSKWIMIVAFLLGLIFLLICFSTLFWVFYWQKRKERKKEKKALSAVQISEEKSNPQKPKLKRTTSQ